MKLRYDLTNQVSNKYKLSTTLKSWLPVLQANVSELEDVLEGFKKDNPFLDVKSGYEKSYGYRDFYSSYRGKNSSTENIEKMNIDSESLHEVLSKQIIPPLFPTPRSQDIAMRIIEDINKDGFFDGDIIAIAEEFEVYEEEIERVRQRFSKLEPVGIAALDLKESFMFQLDSYDVDSDGVYQTTKKLIENIDEIHKFKKLDHYNEAITIIKTFKTSPAIEYMEDDNLVIPDIFVNIDESNKIEVSLNNDYYPTITIDCEGVDNNLDFVKQKIKEANDLVDSLKMRKATIYKIGLMIIEYQYDFFYGGEIKPMKLKDLADEFGHNPSTISRAISNKYLECSRGIIPIKNFFTAALDEDVSNSTIKNFIQELVKSENKAKPMSDMKILTEIEKKFDITIVRRTIAKYRKQLNIGSSSERKKMYLVGV
jgi:RNA polymerase sigma-54 factor